MVTVMISMISSPPAAPAPVPAQSEARPSRLAVMEIDSWRRLVGRACDAEVHPDFEARDLGPIHRLPRLFRVLDSLEVDKSESPGPLGWAIQHHLHLLQLPESAKLPLEIPLCGGEVETEHSNTVRRCRIFSITINLGKAKLVLESMLHDAVYLSRSRDGSRP